MINEIIKSFPNGLPLGNITSQLFANVYLNELDQFIKHKLKIKYYICYCDDFIILSTDEAYLRSLILKINCFLNNNLKLSLHPDKISLRRYYKGADFLGYVSFPYFKILRVKTKKRIIRNIKKKETEFKNGKIAKKVFNQTVQSYLGTLKHCNGYKIKKDVFSKFLGMIYFIYGEDSYRSKQKLKEVIEGYKKVHKSGLNLICFDATEKEFDDFTENLRSNSIFNEKKLIILKNVFSNIKFQEKLLENIKKINGSKDIIVIYEPSKVDQRIKLFKSLKNSVKCQEFSLLTGLLLKKWAIQEFNKYKTKISPYVIDVFLSYVGNDLWKMENEIKKISHFKNGQEVKIEDIELQVKSKTENDIFKTIEALASKDKKQAIKYLQKHLEVGDNILYIFSMIAYQFRNLMILKQLQDKNFSYDIIVKKSGLHPFVVKKSIYMTNKFSIEQLKEIYKKILKIDFEIKTGKIDPEVALEIFVAKI